MPVSWTCPPKTSSWSGQESFSSLCGHSQRPYWFPGNDRGNTSKGATGLVGGTTASTVSMLPSWWLLVKLDARHIPCVCPLLISLPVTFILLTGNDWNGTSKSVLGHRKYIRMIWNTYAEIDFWCKVCLTNTNTEPKSNTVYHNHTFEVHSLGFGCAYHTCFTRTDGPSNSSWVYLQGWL